jgi:glucokinase
MSAYAVGIDLGGTNLKAALVHDDDGLVETARRPTHADRGPDFVIDQIGRLAEQMRAEAPSGIAGVGIGSPGAINWERTTVSQPPNLPGWTSVDLNARLSDVLDGDLPIIVENDANVAGLGSAFYGAGREHDSFLMVTLGTGVGGAIIYRNRIFRGTTGGAAEIGHMTIDYEGPYANSGVAGAIEGYLGQSFLSDHAADRLTNHPDSKVYDLVDDLSELTPKVLYDAAEAGDAAANDILAWAGHKLGVVLGSAVNLLDIRTVIVGGGVSAAGDYILAPARETLPQFVVPGLREDLSIIQETLGNEASLLGAARLAFEGRAAQV